MKRPDAGSETSMSGYEALREVRQSSVPDFSESTYQLACRIERDASYYHYLDHPDYDKYMRIHKVLVGRSGAHELLDIADSLAGEGLPEYLDAAGSAYLETALALDQESAVSRMRLVTLAEDCWQRSISASQRMAESEGLEALYGDTDEFRTALNIAYAPITKSLIVGNVTDATRSRVFADTLAVAQTSAVQLRLASSNGNELAIGDHLGFLHECNALLSMLYIDDPRYVPVPSFSRSDSGFYNGEQTHDIALLNQHWGKIKKIIPVEVKAKTYRRDVDRYRALLVRGKMHLIARNAGDPLLTLEAFTNVYEDTAKPQDYQSVEYASGNLLELLKLYQKGSGKRQVNSTSPTKFHDAKHVRPKYFGPNPATSSRR